MQYTLVSKKNKNMQYTRYSCSNIHYYDLVFNFLRGYIDLGSRFFFFI